MSENAASGSDPVAEALYAAQLFLTAPKQLRGLVLKGYGPARDAIVDAISAQTDLRRLPANVDDERLLGGIDVAASLAAGQAVRQKGLLEELDGAALLVPMAERLNAGIAGRLVQALDNGADFGLILLDDAVNAEDEPPANLMDRIAFHCDLTGAQYIPDACLESAPLEEFAEVGQLDDAQMTAIAGTAAALGVHSARALQFATQAARASAAIRCDTRVTQSDIEIAVGLILASRATQLPPTQEPTDDPPPPPQESPDTSNMDANDNSTEGMSDKLVEAAQASIPADLLAQLVSGKLKRKSGASGSGNRQKSAIRGKPLGARSGVPRGGARLSLIDSLRAAVPWQALRKRGAGLPPDAPIQIRKDDLKVRRFEEKAAQVTIFCVDASGSAAAARLAEAKGAVELMLAQAYVTRSEVALIAFRGESSELLLPPTRSLTRARRSLAELPGGGGTPLASGINAGRELAELVRSRGKTPSLIVLTDGRGNIAANGEPGRKQAAEDTQTAAKRVAASQIDALVVDISARPGPDAPALAETMQARFLALPRADAKALHAAITAETKARQAA